MDEESRPNPEELLKAVEREESQIQKGRLKIFLGMSAGVGKTYAMLEEAQKLKKLGVELVVGVINTHGRKETAALLEGLELVPEKEIIYKGTSFHEFDIDTILERKPALVMVDELAHSNIPGSRHLKRWQDVMEILDNGIDVFSTLNIQHVESLRDVVESITGIVIRETVPDQIIETASNIVLVDITTAELLERLGEGKVYLGDQSAIASKHFFQEDRLTALREIVLRFAAEKVDHDLHGMVSTVGRVEGWRPREKLLVAIGPSPHSQRLIRTTRRLAFTLNAPWIALWVDTGSAFNEDDKANLNKNLNLARDLGAEVVTTCDTSIANGIERIAKQRSVSQIIIGRAPKRFFLDLFSRSQLLDELARECSEIDIHVIRQTLQTPTYRKKIKPFAFPKELGSYFLASGFIVVLGILSSLASPWISYHAVGFAFLAGILLLSLFLTIGPLFLASILSAAIWDLFFIPPIGEFGITSGSDSALMSFYLLTALFTGVLTDRMKKNKEMLLKREASVRALYEIIRDIAAAPSTEQVTSSVKRRLGIALDGTCEIIIKRLDDGLSFESASDIFPDDKEVAAASWVFENNKEAGWSTSTLPVTKHLYLPLRGFSETVGVLAYRPNTKTELSPEEKNFLYTVGQQLANFLERSLEEEKERKIEQYDQIEKIYQTVLDRISNQFQSPLQSIQSAIVDLQATKLLKDHKVGTVALYCIESSSKELLRAIENATAMAKLSTGAVGLKRGKHNINELITVCCENATKLMNAHSFKIEIEENLPLVDFDFSLIEILLSNLISNALEYSPPKSTVEIEARRYENTLILSISDEGSGIPQEMMTSIFDKFYRGPGTCSLGLGLGLSIAKTIAELHGGSLKAENRKTGGAKVTLFLPIQEGS